MEEITNEIEKLWSEYGKLQARREETVNLNQAITARMNQIYQRISELSKNVKQGEVRVDNGANADVQRVPA